MMTEENKQQLDELIELAYANMEDGMQGVIEGLTEVPTPTLLKMYKLFTKTTNHVAKELVGRRDFSGLTDESAVGHEDLITQCIHCHTAVGVGLPNTHAGWCSNK
jgi:hypothetical protein